MLTRTIAGKTITIFPRGEGDTPILYLHTFSDEGQMVYKATQDGRCPPFTLVTIHNLDWNHDLVPWDSPPAVRQGQPCTGGADHYLGLLTETILPAVEEELAATPRWRGIAGYSLAGLFALYALYQTDLFSRVASISGSLWFPGFKKYLFSHMPKRLPDCMYFSLGTQESKTRNPVLRLVGQNTAEIQAFFQAKGSDTLFQRNPGNHFAHEVERTAAGLVWLASRPV